MNNIIKILDYEFLITKDFSKIKFCEINSKYKTKIIVNYILKNENEDIEYITGAIIEEVEERILIREIEN
jgi:hypothetical protein